MRSLAEYDWMVTEELGVELGMEPGSDKEEGGVEQGEQVGKTAVSARIITQAVNPHVIHGSDTRDINQYSKRRYRRSCYRLPRHT